jgi:hypothetical protein
VVYIENSEFMREGMKMINKVNKPITYFLISFLIIFILSFSVIFIMEKEISKSKSEDIMASEARIVTTKTQILEDALYRIIGDFRLFKSCI